ncbi:ParA family protein [Pannonibacter phragmitetus]|uniref:ParA family protein n=1 Tax=Pannonibacter phragmitetus TaxID=121719 RepID=UPI000F036362|nr:ParA family protein [Pannonibacter phragmitetus]
MPVIVLCSTKGGVGKSTTALVLAQVYAQAGSSVTLIDADPNKPLATWAKRFADSVPKKLKVIGDVTETNIIEVIDDEAEKNPFVIVDLEGSANITASYAISRADLVLIPMRGKQLDADQAGRVVALIERESKAFRRTVPYRVMFSMTSALQSKEQRHIRKNLEAKNIPVLGVALTERAAFSAIFQLGGTIFDLTDDDVSKPKAAQENASAVASAVIETLRHEEAA